MDYADKLDMMDDDCDIEGFPLKKSPIMIDKVEMGKVYFKLDNTIETREPLFNLFLKLGFTLVKTPSFNEPNFYRSATFTNNDGLTFKVIWFRNLAHIRIGEWGKVFVENSFTKIVGSYIPNCEHHTLDFLDGDKKTITLSIKK